MHYVFTKPATTLGAMTGAASARSLASHFATSGATQGAAAGILSSRELQQIVADLIG